MPAKDTMMPKSIRGIRESMLEKNVIMYFVRCAFYTRVMGHTWLDFGLINLTTC